MSKIYFFLTIIIFTGCAISDIEPQTSAMNDFDSFRIAVFNDNLSEVWFRLSYAVRDKISYKNFVKRWNEIKANLQLIFASKIVLIRDTITGNNLSGKVLRLRSDGKDYDFVLVVEYDNKRFPGETRAIWRIRGFEESKTNSIYGLFNFQQ